MVFRQTRVMRMLRSGRPDQKLQTNRGGLRTHLVNRCERIFRSNYAWLGMLIILTSGCADPPSLVADSSADVDIGVQEGKFLEWSRYLDVCAMLDGHVSRPECLSVADSPWPCSIDLYRDKECCEFAPDENEWSICAVFAGSNPSGGLCHSSISFRSFKELECLVKKYPATILVTFTQDGVCLCDCPKYWEVDGNGHSCLYRCALDMRTPSVCDIGFSHD
jgi:hypothetical protein